MKFKTNFFDLAKSIALIVVCAVVAFKIWDYDFNKSTQRGLDETTIIKLAENVVKAQVVANDANLKTLINELKRQNSIAIEEANKNKESIMEVGRVIAKLESGIDELKSSFIHKDDQDPEKDLDFAQVYREASDGTKFPTADIYYSPNLIGEERWTVNKHPLYFYTTIVETETEEGFFNRYAELHIENRRIPSLKGKLFPIKVEDIRWEKRAIKDKKFRFNPRLSFGASITIKDIYPNIGMSLFSYGRTKRDMDWRFITLQAGGNNEHLSLGLTPVSYNIGEFLPLVENLFLGLNVSINTDNELFYGSDISVPF